VAAEPPAATQPEERLVGWQLLDAAFLQLAARNPESLRSRRADKLA